ncbi:MAG: hypothetical protein QF822_05575 [Candidatus Poseidoniia archaeon]|jgi:hypothetical protein|nr:hypothetical protein [Candidatus Poseidoniia archaeon]|tara:strand:- start:314 stop:511 length:198 start_codon:yes stop_codon:yes gene_type:complete
MSVPDTLVRKQKVFIRERNGRRTYVLVVPLEFGEEHDLKHNREVLVEYGEKLVVTPLKGGKVATD